ncbi:hypothetical protein [Desulfofustis limnaeus]|nr:hypothetical protein [Desulfofustis limnaeus]MDX9894837.1 hypothetical protein [Desulfofustis sp.]
MASIARSDYPVTLEKTTDFAPRKEGLTDMDKRYLLYKFCRGGDRHLITWLTASGMEEARLAVKLLRKNHPQEQDLALGEGEFFEIIEENQLKSGEWEQAMQVLSLRKGGLHTTVGNKGNDE